MSRQASEATLLRNSRAEIKQLAAELFEARREATSALRKAEQFKQEVQEWKDRFDLLLRRDIAQGAAQEGKTNG